MEGAKWRLSSQTPSASAFRHPVCSGASLAQAFSAAPSSEPSCHSMGLALCFCPCLQHIPGCCCGVPFVALIFMSPESLNTFFMAFSSATSPTSVEVACALI